MGNRGNMIWRTVVNYLCNNNYNTLYFFFYIFLAFELYFIRPEGFKYDDNIIFSVFYRPLFNRHNHKNYYLDFYVYSCVCVYTCELR